MNKLFRYKTVTILSVFFLIISSTIGPINPWGGVARADVTTFNQNQGGHGGYEVGMYATNAIQPTSTNWTRQSSYTGPSQPTEKWAVPAGDNYQSTPAIDNDGTIYVGNTEGDLNAFNPDGSLKWEWVGNTQVTSPIIGADGTIYVCVQNVGLVALNPDGSQKWIYSVPKGDSSSPISYSPAIGADGTIYFAAGLHSSTAVPQILYAVNANGTLKWNTTIDSVPWAFYADTPYIAKDGSIYITLQNASYALYAFNSDGTKKWSYADGDANPAIGDDGTVYMAGNNGFMAINPDGTLKWAYPDGSSNSAPAIGTDGTIYYINYDGSLYAMNPDGTVKWSCNVNEQWGNSYADPVIGADGVIYYAGGSGTIYAVNPDGTLKWTYVDDQGANIESAPVISQDGTLYFGADVWDVSMNSLYALSSNNSSGTSNSGESSISGINAVTEIAKQNPEIETSYYASDPINTSTGAHEIDRTLLKVNGEQPLTFNIRYNSLLLNAGLLGNGWEHPFEASLEARTDGSVVIHWSANHANSYSSIGNNQYASSDMAAQYDTLVKNGDGSYTLTRKDQRVYQFNTAGQLVQLQNGHGQSLTLSYDSSNHLVKVAEPISGQALNFHYNASGWIDSVTDNLNRQISFVYDANQNLTEITDANGKTTTYSYESNGRVLTETDAEGITLFTDTYDSQGRVSKQQDALSNATTFSYDETQPGKIVTTVTDRNGQNQILTHDSNYELLSIQDELGKTTTYTYDNNGNKTSVTDPLGNKSSFAYDSDGNLLSVTDPVGNVTTMTYDNRNNVLTVVNAASKQASYTYDTNNNVTSYTDLLGHKYNYTYDSNGLLLSKTNPDSSITNYSYQNGMVQTITDPTGKTISYTYDATGRITSTVDGAQKTTVTFDSMDNVSSIADALGNTMKFTYDSHGDKLTQTDANGNVTTYKYNGNGKLVSQSDALNNTTTYQYDAEDRLIQVTDAKGNITKMNRDAKGRVISTTDPLGHTMSTDYDAGDRVIDNKDALGNQIQTISYDAMNNPLTVTDALGRTLTYHYDTLSRLDQVTDALGNSTHFTYDDLNRIVKSNDAIGGNSEQGFDPNGDRTSLTDPNNNQTNFSFDQAGRLTAITTAAGSTIKYQYNSQGQLVQTTNGRGQVTSYQYDSAGRLSSFTDPVGTVSYTYNANGNIVTISGENGTITRKYDSLNRLTSYTDLYGNTIQYTYDSIGNIATVTYPDGKMVKYDYDAANHLTQVTDWNGMKTQYSYDSNGRLVKTVRPDGSVENRSYDAAGQMTQLGDVAGDSSTINQSNFTYDAAGNVATEQNNVTGDVYTYTNDALGRLLQENVSNTGSMVDKYQYTYDATGNLLTDASTVTNTTYDSTGNGTNQTVTSNVDMTYTANNRLATYNGSAVTYDADGNMTNGPLNGTMANFEYDARNRLVSANGLSYTYDANNNRVAVTQNGVTTRYVVNPNAKLSEVLMDTDASGKPINYYVYGLGLIGKIDASGNYSYYHYDRRGSTVALTDETGKVTDRFAYNPYGEMIQHTGTTSTPFLFNGRDGVMTDSNGLYYMRARYYNPQIRRFINEDVVLGNISSGQTLNRFAYVNGQPISYVDPFGMSRDEDQNGDQKFNYTQDILNVFGLIPGLNIPVNAANAIISATQGNWGTAGIYAAGMIPFVSDLVDSLKLGETTISLAEDTAVITEGVDKAEYEAGTGEYGDVGGHHIHAKSAFIGDINYDPKKGFSISQDYMNSRGWNHADMTTKQRQLFKELYESGRTNTLEEHTRIAKEALIAGGATEGEASELINQSLQNLAEQGVTQPTRIPWYSK